MPYAVSPRCRMVTWSAWVPSWLRGALLRLGQRLGELSWGGESGAERCLGVSEVPVGCGGEPAWLCWGALQAQCA